MRRIALSAMALALTLGSASLLAAQQPQAGQGQQQGQRAWRQARGGGEGAALRGITLSAQQKDWIRQIHEKYRAQFQQIRQSFQAGQQAGAQGQSRPRLDANSPQVQQFRTLREQELRDVRAVLTTDQQRAFDQNVAQMRQRMQGQGMRQGMGQGMGRGMGRGMGQGMRHGMGRGMRQGMGQGMRQGGRGEGALLRGITLSAQQKDQVKQIHEKYRGQFQQIRQSLRPAAQQGGAQDRPKLDRNSPQFQQLRSLREQELREIRAVLSGDQQKTFDQNAAQLKQRMEQREQRRGRRQG